MDKNIKKKTKNTKKHKTSNNKKPLRNSAKIMSIYLWQFIKQLMEFG